MTYEKTLPQIKEQINDLTAAVELLESLISNYGDNNSIKTAIYDILFHITNLNRIAINIHKQQFNELWR